MLTILPPNEKTWPYLYKSDARYLAGELVQVRVTRKGFEPEYAPLATAEWRIEHAPAWLTMETILAHDDWSCLFAFQEGKFVGQAVSRPALYGLCELMDIRVDATERRKGIGSELVAACGDWARKKGLKGIRAEVSDQNPVACQFFQNGGFALGGVDKLKRHADPGQVRKLAALRDSVLSFYRFFE